MDLSSRKKLLFLWVIIAYVGTVIVGFAAGVYVGSEEVTVITKLKSGGFSAIGKNVTFNANLSYTNREYLHFSFESTDTGTEFNMTLNANPVFDRGPSAEQIYLGENVTHSWSEGRPEWASFSDDFDLKLPHGGPWSFQVSAEGIGYLFMDVEQRHPASRHTMISSLVDPAIDIASCVIAIGLAVFAVTLWREEDSTHKHLYAPLFLLSAIILLLRVVLGLFS